MTRLREIRLECEDSSIGVREVNQVEVQHLRVLVLRAACRWHLEVYLVASLDQFGDDMTTSLSTATGEYDSLAARCHSCEHAVVWLLVWRVSCKLDK